MDAWIVMPNILRARSRSAQSWRKASLATGVIFGSVVSGLLGCGGSDAVGPALVNSTQLYWALQLNYHAVNMATVAPYNTVHLHAIPLTVDGTPLPGAGQVTYHTADTTILVDSTGLVTARLPTNGQPAVVTASLTTQAVTHVDSVFIQVTDTVPQHPLATFSIHPRPDGIDSAKIAVDNGTFEIPVYATDQGGNTLCNVNGCGLVVSWSSSNPSVATANFTGGLTPQTVGHVTFVATTLAYGILKQDSLPFVIGYPIEVYSSVIQVLSRTPRGSVTPTLSFSPTVIAMGVGGTLIYENFSNTDSIDVVFDNPTAIQGFPGFSGGNLPPLNANPTNWSCSLQCGLGVRVFPVAGTYPYHSQLYGTGGTIIVSGGP